MSPTPLPAACVAVLRRDLTLAWRRRGDIAMPVLYALIVTGAASSDGGGWSGAGTLSSPDSSTVTCR